MAEAVEIRSDGSFQLGERSYRIPEAFSPREVFSYRRLLEPIPDVPGGTSLNVEQVRRQRTYLFRRAAACVIPGLEPSALESLSFGALRALHRWIAVHRPEIGFDLRASA
ncbi:MAG: hypothetical protein RRA92_08935 [Gemmatimonadota bacterium]|nr:hypothetical protein [Gemmatimonadota bacterium]